MAAIYTENHLLSETYRDDMSFQYYTRSISLLNPWLIRFDSESGSRTDYLDNDRMNYLLRQLRCTEQNLAVTALNRRQFDIAEGHCQRNLAYSRRFEGEKKITSMATALRTYSNMRVRQGDYLGALNFAEEYYNLVVVAYDCVHAEVQEAAGVLIAILISKGDLFDAERYAQITYCNLRDKKNGMDQEGEEVATGASNLATVILHQIGDLSKAEKLAREALYIRTAVFGSDGHDVGSSCGLLAKILRAQSKLGEETKDLLERQLAIYTRHEGLDGLNTAISQFHSGDFYYQLAGMYPTIDVSKILFLAKYHFKESLRINSKLFGPTHRNTNDVKSKLDRVLVAPW
jgi:hypothetical protein